jgi:REP element-mobilizing transposase RayT
MGWAKERATEAFELEEAYRDLENKYQYAIDRITTIANGLHYPTDCEPKMAPREQLAATAAATLRNLAKMQQRPKPYLYWSRKR